MMHENRNPSLGLFYAFSSFFVYAVSDAIFKYLSLSYTTFDIRFWVSIPTFLMVIGYVIYRRRVKALFYTKHPYLHIFRSLMIVPIMLIIPHVLETMPLVDFYTVIFTTPMMTCILAHLFFKDKISLRIIMIIALGFLGVVIAFRPGLETLDSSFFLCLVVVLMIAITANIYRLFPPLESKLSFIIHPTIASFLACLFYVTDAIWPVSLFDLFLFSLAALLIILGVVFVVFAYQHASVTMVGATHYSQLLWGLIFGYVIFGDLPDYYMTIGATIVTLSGILLAFSTRRRKKTRKLDLKNFLSTRLQRQ